MPRKSDAVKAVEAAAMAALGDDALRTDPNGIEALCVPLLPHECQPLT
jgi:hypothetical protein